MMRKYYYEAPVLEIIQIEVENGFAQSVGGKINDYVQTPEDSLDD